MDGHRKMVMEVGRNGKETKRKIYFKLISVIKLVQYFYRIYPIRVTLPYSTEQCRFFAKILFHLNATLFTHRDMPGYIETYTVTLKLYVAHTYRYRYYHYCTQSFVHLYNFSDAKFNVTFYVIFTILSIKLI